THSPEADLHLKREGLAASRVHRVGNLMIDTLLRLRPTARKSTIRKSLNLEKGAYSLLTLHRPSNVDRESDLRKFAALLETISASVPVVFPVHPRTIKNAQRYGLWNPPPQGLRLVEPMGYLDFLHL